MNDVIIKIDNVSKEYRLGVVGTQTLRGDLQRWWALLRGREDPAIKIGQSNVLETQGKERINSQYVWALKDINLEINKGDVLGIIGKNGAGKSTLLKLLSRITTPTTGSITVKGKIASLLEVGTGFHPELTGRENIFLNGAVLGMTRLEIKKKFNEIVAFSGVGNYIDTPVKRYSSGMYVRLAFAVAAYLEPDILVVDEVLSVGDSEFQKKALGKMQDVSKTDGRTILFVSHNMQSISTLTRTCIYLKNGNIVKYGKTKEVIDEYLNDEIKKGLEYSDFTDSLLPKVVGVKIFTSRPSNVHRCNEELKIEFKVYTPFSVKEAAFSFQFVDTYEREIVHIWISDSDKTPLLRTPGIQTILCIIPKFRLYLGHYTLKTNLAEYPGGRHFQTIEKICPIEIVMYDLTRDYEWKPNTCTYLEDAKWVL